jgi:hypothetical protein
MSWTCPRCKREFLQYNSPPFKDSDYCVKCTLDANFDKISAEVPEPW